MKKVTYVGEQSLVAVRGQKAFKKGEPVILNDDEFKSIKAHQVIAALIKSGELQCEDVAEAVTEKATVSTDYQKLNLGQLFSALKERNIFFEPDAKKDELVALLQKADADAE